MIPGIEARFKEDETALNRRMDESPGKEKSHDKFRISASFGVSEILRYDRIEDKKAWEADQAHAVAQE